MIVVDTNVVSEPMLRLPSPQVVEWFAARLHSDLRLTAPSKGEILYGVARLPAGARRSGLQVAAAETFRALAGQGTLAFDDEAAEHDGSLVAERERAGRPISTVDAQIAAICLVQGATLATRNIRDFEDLGLPLVNPWD